MMILLEWVGTIAGIAGAGLMASRTSVSGWAYPVWLVSSLSLSAFALLGGFYGLLLLQGVFSFINLLGIYRWLIIPYRETRGNELADSNPVSVLGLSCSGKPQVRLSR